MIAELLAEAGRQPERIVVDIGPGSFTGVRIGLAAARALALAWACPVHGVTADTLVARAAFEREDAPERLLVVLDAFRSELFVREWTADGPRGAFEVLAPADVAARAALIGAVAGSGVPLLAAPPAWVDATGPDARAARWLRANDLASPTPLYIRAPDAIPAP